MVFYWFFSGVNRDFGLFGQVEWSLDFFVEVGVDLAHPFRRSDREPIPPTRAVPLTGLEGLEGGSRELPRRSDRTGYE
jgi:hypothetical protein